MSQSNNKDLSPIVKITLGLGLAGLLVAVALPQFVKPRNLNATNACIHLNVRLIANAKTQWANEHLKPPGAVPAESDILPYLKDRKMPICPAGGTYLIGPIRSNPVCSLNEMHLGFR